MCLPLLAHHYTWAQSPHTQLGELTKDWIQTTRWGWQVSAHVLCSIDGHVPYAWEVGGTGVGHPNPGHNRHSGKTRPFAKVPWDLHKTKQNTPRNATVKTVIIYLKHSFMLITHTTRESCGHTICVYELNQQKVNVFVWDETVEERGADMILSCFLKCLRVRKDT